MTEHELKIRRLTNQYLLAPAGCLTVVRDLCGIQAQFMSNAMHSLKIRCTDFDESTVSGGLVKNWTIRGTVHIFAESDLPLFICCNGGLDYRRNEWNDVSFWNQRDKWALTPERQKYFSVIILESLKSGPKTREELKQICREKGMDHVEEDSMFDSWGGGIRELCERGFMNYAVCEEKKYCLAPEFVPMADEKAQLELARRYFTNFAPATISDARYFFRATSAQVKKWLSALPVESCDAGGRTYFWIENGKSHNRDIPKCLLLAGFDQLMLGYEKNNNVFLPAEYLRGIFNLAGIVMPAVMIDGRVVGKWKKKGRKVSVELFESLGDDDISDLKDKIESLWDIVSCIEIQ